MYTGVFTGSCINVYNLHIIKKILMDKGKYKTTTNNCYHAVEEIIIIIEADKK